MSPAAAMRCFCMSPSPAAVLCFDVSAAATAAARWLERLNLLLVLTLKGLHFLRVLTL